MIFLLNTNVIIRFLTGDQDIKYKNLYAFFHTIETGKIRVELKLIAFFQVVFVLKSFYKVSKDDIVELCTVLFNRHPDQICILYSNIFTTHRNFNHQFTNSPNHHFP